MSFILCTQHEAKCPRTAGSGSASSGGVVVGEAEVVVEFDAIVVEEVTECTMAGNEAGASAEVADDDYEYEYVDEEDEEEATLVESVDIPSKKPEHPVEETFKPRERRFEKDQSEKTKAASSSEDPYSSDHLELRRALHRAGLASRWFYSNKLFLCPFIQRPVFFSFISSSVTSPVMAKYAAAAASATSNPSETKAKSSAYSPPPLPSIDVEKEMAAAANNASPPSPSPYKGFYSIYPGSGSSSKSASMLLPSSSRISDARDKEN